uniref:Uncharacterized protein n=1 Tax=Sphaerodactylus townsendi TaxID=933632 RepID=A0ACB8EGW3_9SAUR
MAALEQLQSEVACSLCLEDFKEPVSISCGHNFCRPCIKLCWANVEGNFLCPQCRETIPEGTFRPNRVLGNIAELVKRLQSEAAAAAATPVGNAICARHQEPLKLFCQQDEAPICVICRESRIHQSHKVLPIEEAAKDYKKLIQSELQELKRERENAISRQPQDGLTIKEHLENLDTTRKKITSQFELLHQYFEEMEQLLLDQLDEIEMEVQKGQKESNIRFSEEISILGDLISEMEETCQQSASEFLQSVKNVFSRSNKEELHLPVEISQDLKEKLSTFDKKNVSLENILKKFKAESTETHVCGGFIVLETPTSKGWEGLCPPFVSGNHSAQLCFANV